MKQRKEWYKITLLFPVFDNDGNPFPAEVWSWWADELAELVKGFTDRGVWHGQAELNREIFMVVKTKREVDAIRDFLRRARRKFRQKVMYFDYHHVRFEEVK